MKVLLEVLRNFQASPSKSKEQRLPLSPDGRPLKFGVDDELVKAYVNLYKNKTLHK